MSGVRQGPSLSLGQVLKDIRTSTGLSQRDLAERIEVDQTYVSHLENDRRDPSVRTLRKIAHAFDVPVSTLLVLALWSELGEVERQAFRPVLEQLMELTKSLPSGGS